MYDVIGDIHGHGTILIKLLNRLGYKDYGKGYCHNSRKVIFLGDFIDRGEELAEHKLVLNTVMKMVGEGYAYAVMGNHEFNAIAFHTKHNDQYLRPHTQKNTEQHQAFLNEYSDNSVEKKIVLAFFLSLPLWLDFGDLRVVHACWDEKHISNIKRSWPSNCLNKEILVQASIKGTPEYLAVETLLKGVEVVLPDGEYFHDIKGHKRHAIRVSWWKQGLKTFSDAVVPAGMELGIIEDMPLPAKMPGYPLSMPPCFIGHYQLSGKPAPLVKNIGCVDYSVSKTDGKLVAYRWDGEKVLDINKFVY